jgi:hypothetical protein
LKAIWLSLFSNSNGAAIFIGDYDFPVLKDIKYSNLTSIILHFEDLSSFEPSLLRSWKNQHLQH